MRTVLVVVYACVAFASAAFASAAFAQSEQQKPPLEHHHVKRADPENATMPEKKDWISQTLGDLIEGIDDLGKPLREPQR